MAIFNSVFCMFTYQAGYHINLYHCSLVFRQGFHLLNPEDGRQSNDPPAVAAARHVVGHIDGRGNPGSGTRGASLLFFWAPPEWGFSTCRIPTMWYPPLISLFITPSTIDISTISPSFWRLGDINQLSYLWGTTMYLSICGWETQFLAL